MGVGVTHSVRSRRYNLDVGVLVRLRCVGLGGRVWNPILTSIPRSLLQKPVSQIFFPLMYEIWWNVSRHERGIKVSIAARQLKHREYSLH